MPSAPARLFTALLCVTCTSVSTSTQPATDQAEHIQWLQQHAVELRTLDPNDEDFSDLTPLKTSLEGVRVVMLGEPGHGGGMTMLARSRLVKFLHQEKGFDVLAWEAGFYDVLAKAETGSGNRCFSGALTANSLEERCNRAPTLFSLLTLRSP